MRLEASLLDEVREIAKSRGVTITHLVDQHFRELVHQQKRPKADEELGIDQA
jgi:predicted DNA-binding ribbon-helix-helix protein